MTSLILNSSTFLFESRPTKLQNEIYLIASLINKYQNLYEDHNTPSRNILVLKV